VSDGQDDSEPRPGAGRRILYWDGFDPVADLAREEE